MRPQPLIAVVDVEASSRFYQHLLGCTSAHGGLEYERLVHGGRLVLQLHRFGVAHDHGAIGDPADRPYGNGVLLWFEIEDLDAAVARAEALGAEIVLPTHRNPLDGAGGPDHRECWLRDPDGYTVVLASPDGEASGWLPPLATRVAPQLSVRGGRAAIAFYAAAFGARTTYLVDAGDAVVAELAVGETTIWVSDESPEHGHSSPRRSAAPRCASCSWSPIPTPRTPPRSPPVRARCTRRSTSTAGGSGASATRSATTGRSGGRSAPGPRRSAGG